MFGSKREDIFNELREIHGALQRMEIKMAIDTTQLLKVDQAILDAVSALPAVVTSESTKIQTSIDNLAAVQSSDPSAQAVIDAEVARLQTVAPALSTITDSINALPTTPTPPATTGA